MKVNELMIGDWVNLSEDKDEIIAMKILEIDITEGVAVGRERGVDLCGFDDIFPIPITPEILEKNFDFDKVGDYYSSHFMPFLIKEVLHECFAIYVTEEDMWKYNEITTFSSVHELQNILRVLGYSDLADNFKV